MQKMFPFDDVMWSFYGHHQRCLSNPIFSNLVLGAACWAYLICHHELWPLWVSHPFFFLNRSLGLSGGKHYQKITIPIFSLILQNFAIPGCSLYSFQPLSFLLTFFWLACYCSMRLYFSQVTSWILVSLLHRDPMSFVVTPWCPSPVLSLLDATTCSKPLPEPMLIY